MIKVNGEALSESINLCLKEMERAAFIEDDTIAIAEINGMQVQVRITRNEEDFLDLVQPGMAEAQ